MMNSRVLGTPQQALRQITLNKEQITGGFVMMLSGMLGVTVQHVPPHELADIVMQQAARLLAAIDQPEARASMAASLAESFKLAVETNAVAMRTTLGGVVIPSGFKKP
jgi:hypothetical protein